MTIYDAQLELEASTRTWSTSLQYATNTIALGNLRDVGAGTPLYVEFQVTEAFTTSDAATFVGTVIVANATNMSGDSQIVGYLGNTATPMTAAMLALGARFTIPIGTLDETRKTLPDAAYLGFIMITTNNWTAGKLNIRVVLHPNDNPEWKTFDVNSKMALDH